MKTLLLLLCCAFTVSLSAADRAALVIGNNDYQNATHLQTAVGDARAVWTTLGSLGFSVGEKPVLNASLEDTVEAIEAFKLRAQGASSAIVYFAGHGIEHDGVNYLIPVDAMLEKAVQLKTQAYSLNTLLAEVKSLRVPTRLVILDCCRNNPLPERSWTRGDATLADIADETLGGATMVVFSAAPGTKAKDRLTASDTHSPFAAALLQQLAVPGQGLFNLFGEVEKSVFAATGESQKPKLRFSEDVSPFATFLLHPGQQVVARVTSEMSEEEGQRRVAMDLKKRMDVAPDSTVSAPTSLLDSGAPGKVIQFKLSGGELMRFCFCPLGSFTMGSPKTEKNRKDGEEQVEVRISRGYWMAQTECTQGQWKALMGSNPSQFKGDSLPVENVSWDDAQAFITALNSSVNLPKGWKMALPSEAQWEYACRAGTEGVFAFGETLTAKQANFDGRYSYGTSKRGLNLTLTTKVQSYQPNAWGLYDTHGNVCEWSLDGWDGSAALPGGTDPLGTSSVLSY